MKNKFLQLLFLPILFLFADFGASAQTTVPALITSNQVWDIGGSPYIVNQNTYIDTGVKVIVKPGVEIKTSGQFRIDINGEFQAIGKWDSIIKISKLMLQFSKNSKDYNRSTGRGAYFNYCQFEGNGSGTTTIAATTTCLKVDNCIFTNTYFAIDLKSSYPYDTILVDISNTQFYGDNYGYGYPISCNIMESKLNVINCLFKASYGIYSYGNVIYKNNTFNKVAKLDFSYLYGSNEISCNRFINMTDGINLNVSSYKSKGTLKFLNNTIDSFGNSTSFPGAMLTLTRPISSSPKFGIVEINNNNFLLNKGKGVKVAISGSNQTPTKTDSVDFRNNYWGSNDSATITGYIKDYNDDINIIGRVDFSSYKNAPVTGCSYNTGCARANFKYTMKDSMVTFKDSSFGSKPYKVKWKFGDGNRNDSNKKTIIHHYNTPGTYLACLYVYDTADNFCDSMCSVIIIKNKTKCSASYYIAVDTTKPNYVYIVNTSKGTNSNTKYYWTFGDGSGSSSTNPSHTYGASGKYQLCLTIFDTTAGCFSTFCDSLEINSSGKVLLVLNEKDVTGIMNTKVFNALSVYPNPSSGSITINLSTNQLNSVRIDIMNAQGQILKTEYHRSEVGYNDIPLDLSNFEDGLYFLLVRTPDFSKNLKIVLRK